MLRKGYPGRQMEYSNSNQHEINHKIKGVNDHKRKKTLPKMTVKQEMKHRNVTLRFTSITGMMRNMNNKLRRTLKLKTKLQNLKIKKRKKLKRMKRSLW